MTTNGPDLALKFEIIDRTISLEVSLIIADVQRGGPLTDLPGPSRPTCRKSCSVATVKHYRFGASAECAHRYRPHRHRLLHLSDLNLVMITSPNVSKPWRVPSVGDLPNLPWSSSLSRMTLLTKVIRCSMARRATVRPLARQWVVPNVPGLKRRIGRIEKTNKYLKNN